jgi:hypothetical protein
VISKIFAMLRLQFTVWRSIFRLSFSWVEQAALQKGLTQDSYKKNASRLSEAIRRAGGVTRSADIVEQVISTGKPVYR